MNTEGVMDWEPTGPETVKGRDGLRALSPFASVTVTDTSDDPAAEGRHETVEAFVPTQPAGSPLQT